MIELNKGTIKALKELYNITDVKPKAKINNNNNKTNNNNNNNNKAR